MHCVNRLHSFHIFPKSLRWKEIVQVSDGLPQHQQHQHHHHHQQQQQGQQQQQQLLRSELINLVFVQDGGGDLLHTDSCSKIDGCYVIKLCKKTADVYAFNSRNYGRICQDLTA